MPIAARCKKCKSTWKVREKLAGKRVKCGKCGAPIAVPVPGDGPVSESSSVAGKGKPQRRKVRKKAPAGGNTGDEMDFGNLGNQGEALGDGKLIECSECGDVYGEKSNECVHCGAPNLEKKARVRKQKKKKKKGSDEGSAFITVVKDFMSEYQLVIAALGLVACVGAVVWGIAVFGLGRMKVERGTRQQVEFRGKSTGAWLDLEKEGKARRNESLWSSSDNRWLKLENELGLDFAALPELFNALTDDRTRRLAESALGKQPTRKEVTASWGPGQTERSSGPQLVDLEPGFKHTDPLVHKWAAKMALYYEGKREDVFPFLEKIADSADTEASKAARSTIEKLNEKQAKAAARG